MLAAGKMDRRILIESRSVARSASGEETETWSTFATVWARFQPMTGREFYSAGGSQNVPAETARFTVRYLDGVTAQHRIVHGSKTWNIRNVAEIGRREGLEITAEAVAQ